MMKRTIIFIIGVILLAPFFIPFKVYAQSCTVETSERPALFGTTSQVLYQGEDIQITVTDLPIGNYRVIIAKDRTAFDPRIIDENFQSKGTIVKLEFPTSTDWESYPYIVEIRKVGGMTALTYCFFILHPAEENPNELDITTIDVTGNCGKGYVDTALGCISTKSPSEFVKFLLSFAIGIGGGIAFLLIIFGGFQIILSGGNPDRIKAGKEMITAALAGLLLIIFSVFILRVIGYDILRLPGFNK